MRQVRLLFVLCVFTGTQIFAQRKTENIVIFTLDGMRWEEVFGGIDSAILNNPKFTREKDDLTKKFWSDDAKERRKKLFPFIWTTVAAHGQIYGNRMIGNNVNNANPYWFSYPGYNEIFTGYPDTAVNSNDKIKNKNTNVLEFLNQQRPLNGKVAAFSTWDCFPYILNKWRSGIYVNSDVDSIKLNAPSLKLIDDIQFLTTKPIGVRPDILTYMAGREYLKAYKPRVLYVAFDETDDYAHAGLYDQYLGSAHAEDGMIADLWKTVQSMPEYKDKTTFIIACDHGRGNKIKEQWTDHGQKVEDAGQIWIAVLGPDTTPIGEVKAQTTLYQEQIAATIGALMGYEFKAEHPVAKPITTIYSK
ncbi:MAG: phosphoglyceromutase [Bacteroidetes bacterium]|nr:MAG: phosphoglyceromutase [Bacteroidota bacterium]